ncbi:MAG: hypothetical protein ACI9GW_003201 [Halieaceae bacterium]|jgi:hypothetical protein
MNRPSSKRLTNPMNAAGTSARVTTRRSYQWRDTMISRSVLATICTLILVFANSAWACGESLFHVGKGVVFREYTAPLPGKILMVARTAGELILAERLTAAGHDVKTIADPGQIGQELAQSDFNIVMTLFAERQTVALQMQNAANNISYLPVARDGTDEITAANAVTRHALSTDDSVKNFLRAIHRTLKQHKT